jgi:hypothetical protein
VVTAIEELNRRSLQPRRGEKKSRKKGQIVCCVGVVEYFQGGAKERSRNKGRQEYRKAGIQEKKMDNISLRHPELTQ